VLTTAPRLGLDPTAQHSVVEHEPQNKMTVPNLAVIFGPALMRSGRENRDLLEIHIQSRVAAFLITHALELFEPPAVTSPETPSPLPSSMSGSSTITPSPLAAV